jgi:hypothetical protein
MIKFSDSSKSDAYWQKLLDKTNPDLVDAMRDFYSIYDTELVEWFAELYDPKVGGWYYSPSARDNETVTYNGKEYLLRPDAESTCQALGFIGASGIADEVDAKYERFLPTWMKKQIADYIQGLQDPDGYFYHEQWGKNIPLPRRARDFTWSRNMLERLERPLKYPTILDAPEMKTKDTLIPDHLSSEAKFIDYLDSLDVPNKSYHAGNTVSSQFSQIKSQGLGEVCVKYFNERQHADTGLWHAEQNYYGVNGLMKISGIYNSMGLVIPHSMEAAFSAIAAIESDEVVNGGVDLWNNWVAIQNICTSLIKFGGEDGARQVDEIRARIWQNAAGAVRKTRQKITPFKRADHAFSYGKKYPSPTSQSMPVCIPGLDEGDINGCVIASTLMIGMVYGGLGLADCRVPLFGKEEGELFLSIVEKNNAR